MWVRFFFFFFGRPFFITAEEKANFFGRPLLITTEEQGDFFGRPFWMHPIKDDDHLDRLFLWTILCHQNYFLGNHLDRLLLKMAITWINYFFGRSLSIGIISLATIWIAFSGHFSFDWDFAFVWISNFLVLTYPCIKGFIALNDFILARRFYHYCLDNFILVWRIYRWMILFLYEEFYHCCFGWFNSCMKNVSLNDIILVWQILSLLLWTI